MNVNAPTPPVSVPSGKPSSRDHFEQSIMVATFDYVADAEALRSALQKQGVDATLQDERRLQRFWFAASPQAALHVRVPKESAVRVQQLIQSHPDITALIRRAVHCPSCQSSRVEYPAMTRKNLLPTLVAQLTVALRLTHHECYCQDCHYTWIPHAPDKGGSSVEKKEDPEPSKPL